MLGLAAWDIRRRGRLHSGKMARIVLVHLASSAKRLHSCGSGAIFPADSI